MRLGIRLRLIALLLLVVLPVASAGVIGLKIIDARLSARIEADLANSHRLEAARLEQTLSEYARDGSSLASGGHVRTFVTAVQRARENANAEKPIAGIDGFALVDPFSELPLQELALALQGKAWTTGSEVRDLQIVGLDGTVYAQTPGFSWQPYNTGIVTDSITDKATVFGNAFRVSEGDERIGLVSPVYSADRSIVGALVLEMRLGPIIDLVIEHEGFGDSSEAHIAQLTPNGDAEFITRLRFEHDAAFTKIVPSAKQLPINRSLESPTGQVVWAKDYRATESILAIQTLGSTGWGLVVKIDEAEALAPVVLVRSTVILAGLFSLAIAVLGSMLLLEPLSRRLRRAAAAAERIAAGDYRSAIDDRSGDEIGAIARSIDRLARDLSIDIDVRAEVEDQLRRQATHDELTGLYNRQFASVAIRELNDQALANDREASVLFLDLDGFKTTNDTYGHSVGDEVLVIVAKRLLATMCPTGCPDVTVARWGGDEFVILLPDTDTDAAKVVVAQLHEMFTEPFETSAGQHVLACSIGSSASRPGGSVYELMQRADAAMFDQKQIRSGARAHSPSTVKTVEKAMASDRLEVWYQPLVGTSAGGDISLHGAEALVRLRSEGNEVLPPNFFVDDIQELQLGVVVDRFVIASAIEQASKWIEDSSVAADFQMSVNLGVAAMRDPELPGFVEAALADHGLGGANLLIEISENVAELRSETISAMRHIGVQFAVDDVGLHHSNLDRLIDARASVAKIDRRWLRDKQTHTLHGAGVAVLGHLTQLCQDLDLRVIAEGVETEEEHALLCGLGITRFQGFYFGKPMPAPEFAEHCFNSPSFVLDIR